MEMYDKSSGGLTLADAVEVLYSIAETPWDEENDLYGILDHSHIQPKNVSWIESHDSSELITTVKEIFKVILQHIQDHYGTGFVTDSKTLEQIKTIMVAVGEAAKKIDKYTDLFKARNVAGIEGLKEYKQLQEFYRKKISRTIDESMLGKWILALTQRTFAPREKEEPDIKAFESKHVFVDMESVKNDTEYELFFIRKEDGSRFFNPRLIRNIKLVCDFGAYLGKKKELDLWTDQKIWEDRLALGVAESIYQASKQVIESQYTLIAHHKHHELIGLVNKTVMALLLASNKGRLMKSSFLKGCAEYFSDFREFLREILHHRDYQQLIAFPLQGVSPVHNAVRKIVEALLKALFRGGGVYDQVQPYFSYLVKEGNELLDHKSDMEKSETVWSRLANDFFAMQKFFKYHPNGHLNKILDLLEDGNYQTFDPYIQGLVPELLYSIMDQDSKIDIHSLPTPTSQEFIHNPKLIQEFMNLLHFHRKEDGKILIFNFQDRTSWREHSRADVLEEIQEGSEFKDFLTVVTLPKDTEFYHQDPPYHEDHQWNIFKEHLIQHVFDNHTGFYFPEKIKEKMPKVWLYELIEAIHRVFFSEKNVLTKEARLDFIEILYNFIELKLIEVSGAKNVYFCCKDGVDISPSASIGLAAFLKIVNGALISKSEMERFSLILQASAVLTRERVMLPERFHRMLNALKAVENAKMEYTQNLFVKIIHEAFGLLYQGNSLKRLSHFPIFKT